MRFEGHLFATLDTSVLLRFFCCCPVLRSSVISQSISRKFSIAFTSLISFSFLSSSLSVTFLKTSYFYPVKFFYGFYVSMIGGDGLGGPLDFCSKETFRSVIAFLISFTSVCSYLNFLSSIGACC